MRGFGELTGLGRLLARLILAALLAGPGDGVLAQSYEDGLEAFRNGDFARARSIWRQAAESGETRARIALARLLENGAGNRPPDLEAAYFWYAAAAANGDKRALAAKDRLAAALDPKRVAEIDAQAAPDGSNKQAGDTKKPGPGKAVVAVPIFRPKGSKIQPQAKRADETQRVKRPPAPRRNMQPPPKLPVTKPKLAKPPPEIAAGAIEIEPNAEAAPKPPGFAQIAIAQTPIVMDSGSVHSGAKTTEHLQAEASLLRAAAAGAVQDMDAALAKGASVNATDIQNWTPLLFASHAGRPNMVAILLDRGARIDHRDLNGATPLIAATTQGHDRVVRLLLQRGADRNLRTQAGFAAGDIAQRNGDEAILRLLGQASKEPLASPRHDFTVTAKVGSNLRAGPGTNFTRIGRLAAGGRLRAVGRARGGNWIELVMPDGSKAFVLARLVDISPGAPYGVRREREPSPASDPSAQGAPNAARTESVATPRLPPALEPPPPVADAAPISLIQPPLPAPITPERRDLAAFLSGRWSEDCAIHWIAYEPLAPGRFRVRLSNHDRSYIENAEIVGGELVTRTLDKDVDVTLRYRIDADDRMTLIHSEYSESGDVFLTSDRKAAMRKCP